MATFLIKTETVHVMFTVDPYKIANYCNFLNKSDRNPCPLKEFCTKFRPAFITSEHLEFVISKIAQLFAKPETGDIYIESSGIKMRLRALPDYEFTLPINSVGIDSYEKFCDEYIWEIHDLVEVEFALRHTKDEKAKCEKTKEEVETKQVYLAERKGHLLKAIDEHDKQVPKQETPQQPALAPAPKQETPQQAPAPTPKQDLISRLEETAHALLTAIQEMKKTA